MTNPTNAQLLAHVAEMTAVAAGAEARIAEARQRIAALKAREHIWPPELYDDGDVLAKAGDRYGNRFREWAEEDRLFRDANAESFGGLGDGVPDEGEMPRRRPVSSSGRGAAELAAESDTTPGDGTTQAYARLGRELAGIKSAFRKARREIQNILDEAPALASEGFDAAQWGNSVPTTNMAGLMNTIAGRGQPKSLMAKASAVINARVEAAANAGELDLNEQLACSTLLAMMPAANEIPSVHEDFLDRLAKSGSKIQALFGG